MPPTRPLADSGWPLSLHQCRSRVLEPAKLASSWLPLVIPEDKVSYSHRTTTTTADADAATSDATATTTDDDYDDCEKLEALSTTRNLKHDGLYELRTKPKASGSGYRVYRAPAVGLKLMDQSGSSTRGIRVLLPFSLLWHSPYVPLTTNPEKKH